MLVGLGTGLQGCTEEQVAAGVGLAAIGAAFVIIGDSDSDYDRGRDHGRRRGRCEGGYVRRCTTYRDYYGNKHRECRREWDSCKYYSNYSNDNVALLSNHLAPNDSNAIELMSSSASEQKLSAGKLAATFEMSFKSAEFFVASLEQAQEGNPQALLNLGLERKDVELLAYEKMPSAKGIETLARKLNMDYSKAESMMKSLLEEGKEVNKKKCRRIGRPGNKRTVCRAS